jgi:hypothetical protein
LKAQEQHVNSHRRDRSNYNVLEQVSILFTNHSPRYGRIDVNIPGLSADGYFEWLEATANGDVHMNGSGTTNTKRKIRNVVLNQMNDLPKKAEKIKWVDVDGIPSIRSKGPK